MQESWYQYRRIPNQITSKDKFSISFMDERLNKIHFSRSISSSTVTFLKLQLIKQILSSSQALLFYTSFEDESFQEGINYNIPKYIL